MRAYIDSEMRLHLVPESRTEMYHIEDWVKCSEIPVIDLQGMAIYCFRGRSILMDQQEIIAKGELCPV